MDIKRIKKHFKIRRINHDRYSSVLFFNDPNMEEFTIKYICWNETVIVKKITKRCWEENRHSKKEKFLSFNEALKVYRSI